MSLTVEVFLFNPKNPQTNKEVRGFWNVTSVQQAFRQYFSDSSITLFVSVQNRTLLNELKNSLDVSANERPDSYVNVLCQYALSPNYVKGNFDLININGGMFVRCFVTVPGRDRRELKVYHVGFTTCYIRNSDNTYDSLHDLNDLSLYIATICSPKNVPFVTVKGIGSRMLDSIYATCVVIQNFKSVRLDALLYCMNPDQLYTSSQTQYGVGARGVKRKIEESITNDSPITTRQEPPTQQYSNEVDVDMCNLWLHDYYMSKGYQLVNTRIFNESNELFEYEVDQSENKLKKKSSGHKMYKFNTKALVPMIKPIRN
jgi:hypothetical protein